MINSKWTYASIAWAVVVVNVASITRLEADTVAFGEPSWPRLGYLQTSGGSPTFLTTHPTFSPDFLAYDSAGNLYSTQSHTGAGNNSIYKVTPAGDKSVFANVSGASSLGGLAYDRTNNVLYAAAYSNGLIARVTMDGNASTFVSGVTGPFQLAVDSTGNVYSSNIAAGTISKITPSGAVSTFASGFYQPGSLAFDASDTLVVKGSYYFWKITPDGTKTQWLSINPRESNPQQIAFDSTGTLWVADEYYSIWKVDSAGTKTTVLSTAYFSNRGLAIFDGLSSGTVAVPSGQQYTVSTAAGGAIDASAGTAQVDTLAGATLNTGAGGATVTTLTSGVINTAGGSVTTQGGSFNGQITGNGGLTKTGTGTLVLNSANSFTGNTVINAGTVEIAVGDALGTGAAPIRIANNGKFKALAGVAVTKPVVISSGSAVYEHVLGESDSLTNLAPISNNITTADIVAGDAAATTFTSSFKADGSISLHGLNGTRFLMVLDMEGYIPEDATLADTYLGWWDERANAGAGGWVNAVLGNIGTAGSLAGGYTKGYQQFLTANGGWDGTTMLGAYGLDLANQQVWAVIDHNSDFGVTNNGILVVPEPSSLALAGVGLVSGGIWLKRRRRLPARRGTAGMAASRKPEEP